MQWMGGHDIKVRRELMERDRKECVNVTQLVYEQGKLNRLYPEGREQILTKKNQA